MSNQVESTKRKARYRKVSVEIWNDEDFRGWCDRAKLAFMFALTHPHMLSIGCMRATLEGLSLELGWEPKGYRESLREPLAHGSVRYDEKACFLWIPKFLKHNPPENPNVVKSWEFMYDLIPKCELQELAFQEIREYVKGLGEGYAKALPIPFQEGRRKGIGYDTRKPFTLIPDPFTPNLTTPSPKSEKVESEKIAESKKEDAGSTADCITPGKGALIPDAIPEKKINGWKIWIDVNREVGRKDPLNVGKEMGCAKLLASKINDEEELKRLMLMYLRDNEKLAMDSGYTLGILLRNINKYRNGNVVPAVDPDDIPYPGEQYSEKQWKEWTRTERAKVVARTEAENGLQSRAV